MKSMKKGTKKEIENRQEMEKKIFDKTISDLSMKLRKDILIYISNRGQSTTFVELTRRFSAIIGEYNLFLGENNSILVWPSLSKEFIEWYFKMVAQKIIIMDISNVMGNFMGYLFDGSYPSIKPINKVSRSSLTRHYKEHRWLPVLLGTSYQVTREERDKFHREEWGLDDDENGGDTE